MGAVLASRGPVTQAPRNACNHFPRDSQALEARGHLGATPALTHCPWKSLRGRKEDRNSPLPQHQSAFPSAHVGVGQLGLKPHETHHLAPDSRLPHPRPGFNKHCTDGSTKLSWPDPSSLAHCMS